MTEPANPTAAVPFTVVTIFRHFAAFIFQHPGFFLGLMALEGLLILITWFSEDHLLFDTFYILIMWLVCSDVLWGVVAHGVFQTRCGQPLRIGAALGRGLRRILPIAGITLEFEFCLLLSPAFFNRWGLFCVIIFTAIVMVVMSSSFSSAIPACVVERLGLMRSLKRGEELAKGHWSTIFAAYLMLAALAIPLSYLPIYWFEPYGWDILFIAAPAALAIVPKGVMDAVIYCDLREAKDLDLARVFD